MVDRLLTGKAQSIVIEHEGHIRIPYKTIQFKSITIKVFSTLINRFQDLEMPRMRRCRVL
jgi:hypothetical protein